TGVRVRSANASTAATSAAEAGRTTTAAHGAPLRRDSSSDRIHESRLFASTDAASVTISSPAISRASAGARSARAIVELMYPTSVVRVTCVVRAVVAGMPAGPRI